MREAIEITKKLQGEGNDLFRDILPQVTLFLEENNMDGFLFPDILLPRLSEFPKVTKIIHRGVPVGIVRQYNIETNKFSTILVLEGHKPEGTEDGKEKC